VLPKKKIIRAGHISTAGISAGVYIINVLIDNVTYTKKLILY